MADSKQEERARRFSVPGLPSLEDRVAVVRVDGPVQAHRLLIIWENMLCRLVPARLDRIQVRVGAKEAAEGLAGNEPLSRQSAARRIALEFAQEANLPIPSTVPDKLWQSLYMQTSLQLPFQAHATLWAPFCDSETGSLPDSDLDEHIMSRIPPDVLAKPMPWNLISFFQGVFGLSNPNARGLGPKLEIKCPEPAWVHRDGDGLAHSHMGPAAVWPDGSSVYCWRGMRAPASWFPEPTKEWLRERPGCPAPLARDEAYQLPTTSEALNHSNTEMRRIAIEILGWDAIVSELKPVVVDENPDPIIGTLLRVEVPTPSAFSPHATQTQQFVRVKCGTGRTFCLSVPLEMRTALEANAWTYGLTPEEYSPEVRT